MSYIKNKIFRRRIGKTAVSSTAVLLLLALILHFLPAVFATQEYFDYSASSLTTSSSAQTATVSLVAASNITFYTLEGNFFANEDSDGQTYFTLDSMTYSSSFSPSDVLENTVNNKGGIFYWKNTTNGISFNAGDVIWTASYTVAANAPSGLYSLPIVLDAVSFGPNSYIEDETIAAVVEIEVPHYNGTFTIGEHLTVYGCSMQFNNDGSCRGIRYNIQNGDVIGIRNGLGIYDMDGNGELNLLVVPDEGYVLNNIAATSGKYEAIEGPTDLFTPNGYRITKITDNIAVAITATQSSGYIATFNLGTGISSVNVCSVEYDGDICNGAEVTIYNGGIYTTQRSQVPADFNTGQLNFIVNLANGYKLDLDDIAAAVSATGIHDEIEIMQPEVYSFQIAHMASNATVTISAIAQTTITPSITAIPNQTYTSEEIYPDIEVTATVGGSSITLDNKSDYTYEITNNIDAGTATVTIYPVITSDYYFTEFSTTFTILPYGLTSANLSVPDYILAGNELTDKDIEVTANGSTLSACTEVGETDCDYLITFYNTSGSAGENATGNISGQNGNYVNTVEFSVPIQAKPNQTLNFATDSVTVEWGDTVSNALTHSTGDGTISYWSSNENAATVSNNGTIQLVGIGSTTIYAEAAETANYAQTTTSYTLTVNKKSLSITSARVPNKTYDGTTNSEISSVTLSDTSLTYNTDFTATATFASANVGTNITVTIQATLNDTTHYELVSSTYLTAATITALTLTNNNTAASLNTTEYTYSGAQNKPNATITVTINGVEHPLTKNTDYVISYSDDTISAGTKYATISGIGNYTGTLGELPYTISPAEVIGVTIDIPSQAYTGAVLTPEVTITASFNDSLITLNEWDYELSYSETTINAGSYPVTARPITGSNFTFATTSEDFIITAHELTSSDVSLEYDAVHYTGNALEPTVTVSIGGIEISPDYYTVTYADDTVNVNDAVAVTIAGNSEIIPTNLTGSVVKYYAIVDKDTLTMSGIPNNQTIAYTGSPVELEGTLAVSGTNSITGEAYSINPDDITTTWYASDGTTVIDRPTNAGSYSVVYSYEDDNCIGSLSINFTIAKATSPKPAEMTSNLSAKVGTTLADIAGTRTTGFAWSDDTTPVAADTNTYAATYTYRNDTENYTTLNLNVPVRGLSPIVVTVSIIGEGGYTTTSDLTDVLEEDTVKISLTPATGYEIASVLMDGEDVTDEISDDVLTFVAGSSDMSIVITYSIIQHTVIINGTNVTLDPSGTITVNYNDDQTITITPNFGYRLASVLVNDVEKLNDVTDNGTITIANITEDTTVVATATPIVYEVVEGADQTHMLFKDGAMTIKINADYSLFKKGGVVHIDENEVSSSNYTSWDGSTYIKFKASYLDSLSVGTHTLSVMMNDGGVATTTFQITNVKTPDTGFFSRKGMTIIASMALPTLFVCTAATIFIHKKRLLKRVLRSRSHSNSKDYDFESRE